MRQSVINSYIAPLQKLLIRTNSEHITAKESFSEQEMSQNGIWGKIAVPKGAHSRGSNH